MAEAGNRDEIKSPLVSVCIFTYQHVAYIAECIESVLRQETDFPVEIVIGEDGSDDGTREIREKYAQQNPGKIRVISRSRKDVIYINGNPTGRFNFLETIKVLRGKYIAMVDGDDYWTDPLKLQKQADILERDSSLVCCHHWQRVSRKNAAGNYVEEEATKIADGYWPAPVSSAREIFANKMRVKTRTIMYRNIFKDGFRLPGWFMDVQYGDVPLSLILGKFGNFAFINEEMAVYRITGHGVSMAGIRKPDFMYRHFIEWVKIWEYANLHYNGQYQEEAFATILHFYKVILRHYKFSWSMYKMCARYALLKSKLGFFYRLFFFTRVSFLFLDGRLKKTAG